MNVYIIHKDGRPANSNFDDALDGFSFRGFNVIPFESGQLYQLKNTKEDIVCAGIPFMHIIWKNLGVPKPKQIDIPDELLPFAKRKIWIEPFNDVRDRFLTDKPEPVFIKPMDIHKLFTGLVVSSSVDLMHIKDAAEGTRVMCSEVIDIVAEYRCYINFRDQIIDARRYCGDFRPCPDYSVADTIIKAWKDKPIAYSVDLGITKSGETVLIEVNDSYALGNYGIPSDKYSKMLENRWWEIVGIPQNICYN